MKIISFIDEPLLIRRILEHQGLWRQRIPKGLPPPVKPQELLQQLVSGLLPG